MPARAIPEASTQKQSSTKPDEKWREQTVAPIVPEVEGRARPFQIAAIRARKPAAVRLAGLVRERRSSAASAGSCGPLADHDRRQPVASRALPRPRTFQQGKSPTAMREWRSQKPLARHASRARILLSE